MKTESIQRGKPSPYPDDDISNEPILLNAHEQSYLKAVIRISELEKENAALSAQPKEPIEPVSVEEMIRLYNLWADSELERLRKFPEDASLAQVGGAVGPRAWCAGWRACEKKLRGDD